MRTRTWPTEDLSRKNNRVITSREDIKVDLLLEKVRPCRAGMAPARTRIMNQLQAVALNESLRRNRFCGERRVLLT